jgi:hypothetical protein
MYHENMTTNEVLKALGYTKSPAPATNYRQEILKDGEPVGVFNCYECNDYLRLKHPEFFATEEQEATK